MPNVDDVLKQLNDAEKETGSLETGGGALFAKVTVAWGYKVFASGSTHEESFFATPFPPKGDDATKALAAAKLYKQTSGAAGNPAFSWVMSIAPTDVIGKSVNWKSAQHKVSVRWKRKNAAGENKSVLDDVLLPELINLNMLGAGTYFLRIKYMRNPIVPGPDDNPDILWLPAEVYPNEAACREAAAKFYADSGDATGSASAENCPPDWDAKTWNQFKDQVNTSLKNKEAPAAVAATWGIPVPWMVAYAKTLK
jgi:hypothetical protein